MASLLERAVYAPVNARFKVYMIDEVHMLTNHAFNAMLKTLEEPPSHVKFILATTDPQKIPVTVLSRCLQFNLKQMPAVHIVAHLQKVLTEEKLGFELQALRLLARAADGSMRDALSLTDQAIAYAAGQISEEAVRGMLGALDQHYLTRLLDAIAASDGAEVLAIADELAARSLSFLLALQDLSTMLHQIAWAQVAPQSVLDELPEAEDIRRFASLFSPEQVQLYYQIATIGRSELGLAPDEYAGFTMTLLRMLAFYPANTAVESAPELAQAAAMLNPVDVSTPDSLTALGFVEHDWPSLVARLPLRGLVKELAYRSELVGIEGATLTLKVSVAQLAERLQVEKLRTALTEYLGKPLKLVTEIGVVTQTAAALDAAQNVQRQQAAEQALAQDPFAQALIRDFDATIVPGSIKPELLMLKNQLAGLMKQAQQMQENMSKVQEELALIEVEGQSGAGLVKVTLTCKHEVRRVVIDPSLFDDDKDMLEDLIAAAFNDAVHKVSEATQEKMGSVTSDLPLPAGFKLPF
ncbi:hypothetical protein BGZ97_002172 [Linnemannia gamsii]|uniref:DNA polymerase III subunit gamma/tau n=1 Tax=Linnemannia gamsii TaxID=64522 RepID=A0A9P6RHZ9_9FUNG|nr:hypothetical protein BGZ97_002172 [Linnemannia gamsii]